MYHYTDHDIARMYHEPAKRSMLVSHQDERGPFARDRARVLHSAALRSLADKTQVVSPKEGDTPRTRLTHSLEVAQIARGIGAGLGLDPNLCEMAGLTHDIGHPPYGHNGEHALNELAVHCGGFEGNAQTLRILTKLEPKVLDARDHSYGLNLTRAALDAACKYPVTKTNPDGTTNRKYSCYDEDRQILEWVRDGHTDDRAAMEAQVMDFADDIAYSVHDVEDGIISGRIHLNALWDQESLESLGASGETAFGVSADRLVDAGGRLRNLQVVAAAAEFDGSLRGRRNLKAMTSELVGRYVGAIIEETIAHPNNQAGEGGDMSAEHGIGPSHACLGRIHGELIVPDQVLAEVTLLKSLAVLYVMNTPERKERQRNQRERVAMVFEYLTAGAPGALDPMFQLWWEQAEDAAARERVVIDQIASMTESRLARVAQAARDAGDMDVV